MHFGTIIARYLSMRNIITGSISSVRNNWHYAWIIILIAGIMHMAGGSIRQAFGVLIVPLETEFGWSPVSSTLAYALASVVGALLAPISGMATDRYGARKVILVGVAFFFLGSMVTGVVRVK